jgi:hypothetical protein
MDRNAFSLQRLFALGPAAEIDSRHCEADGASNAAS